MIFVITVLSQFAIIDDIEEDHAGHRKLEEGSDASSLRLDILVLPTPPGTATESGKGGRTLVPATEPSAQFTQFHLAKGNIG